jgi:hypothetical protein
VENVVKEIEVLIARLRDHRERPSTSSIHIPKFAVGDVFRLLAAKAAQSVQHVYALESEDADPNAFDLAVWRLLPNRGRLVERIYAVPHAGFGRVVINEMMRLDRQAGVQCHQVTLSALPLDTSQTVITQTLIIDGSLFVGAQVSSDDEDRAGATWLCSVDQARLKDVERLWSELHDNSVNEENLPERVDLEEPLVSSADLISGVAGVLCSGDHVDSENCSWYHGAWQYMRLMDLVSTPTWHDHFYRTSLETLLRVNPQARVLISGTADYSLFAYVVDTAISVGAKPEIVVLDQCATPLFACRWYANLRGFPVSIVQSDVLEFCLHQAGSFDVVTSDAFLTRFAPDDVKEVVRNWASLLRDERSRIVTTVRLHGATTVVRDEEKAIGDFVTRARSRLPRWRGFVRKTPSEIIALSESYIRRMISNRHGTDTDIEKLFQESGLEMIHKEASEVPGELFSTMYLRVMAGPLP